jgi:hypothetical protein
MDSVILEIDARGLHRYEVIPYGKTSIGRALDNDIILSDPTVAPHHLQILRHSDDSIELVNFAAVNPTRVNGQPIDSLSPEKLPVKIEAGRVQVRLLPQDYPVAKTRPLAGSGNRRHLFGHAYWALLLVMLCLLLDGLDFYLNSHNVFKVSELIKFLLRETILTIGAFVLALSILERLLVNRWEIRQLLTSVSLVYLLYNLISVLAGGLDYLLSANWPSTWLFFGWYLTAIPVAIALYLLHISHLSRGRSYLLALLIASPVALPALMQSTQMQAMLENFSAAASYHNKLSYLNWHLRESVDIESFIDQAQELKPGKAAD